MSEKKSDGTAAILGGGLIGAAGSLLGGVINNVLGSKSEKEMWERNYNAQKEFAQNSIQWRVQDAQKAGIHPLYAMGNSPGYTPASSFDNGSVGSAIAEAGNQFSRAMGQIGLMNAQLQTSNLEADLQAKKIDNKNKELELYNKMVSNSLGQKSATIPHVTGQGEANLHLIADSGRGKGRVLPGQLESEVASLPADVAKVIDTQYNRDAIANLPVPKDKERFVFLSPLGYSYKDLPKGSSPKDLGLFENWGYMNDQILNKGIPYLIDKLINIGDWYNDLNWVKAHRKSVKNEYK